MSDMTPSRLLTFFLTSLCLLVALPSAAFAQDTMSFGVDDVKKDDQNDTQDKQDSQDDQGGGTMTFGADEVQNGDQQKNNSGPKSYTLAVVVIPSDAMSREQRIQLQKRMTKAVALDKHYKPQDGAALLNGLQTAGMASCITEPLCLAGVGQDAGVQRILMGRLEQTSRGLDFNIDLFDVHDKLFVKYTSAKRLANFDAVLNSVEPSMKDIFDIRVKRKGPNYGTQASSGTVQKVLAYTSAGLSVVALGAGIYFGTQASSGEDNIVGKKNSDGQFTITQAEADRMVRDVQSDALTANVLYGASAGLAVISGILFYVHSGSDVAAPDTRRRRRASVLDNLQITPQVGLGKVGVGATLSF